MHEREVNMMDGLAKTSCPGVIGRLGWGCRLKPAIELLKLLYTFSDCGATLEAVLSARLCVCVLSEHC